MIPNHSIQPEPDSLSVRWTIALIMSCLSLTFCSPFPVWRTPDPAIAGRKFTLAWNHSILERSNDG